MKTEEYFLSFDEKNPILYIKLFFDYFLSYSKNIPSSPEVFLNDYFSFVEKICSSKVRKKVFIHLFLVRASTVSLIRRTLGLSQSSVYRELDSLISYDLVSKVMSHRDGRGRPITVYAIFGYQSEDIVSAVERSRRNRSPSYSLVSRVKQFILDDYLQSRELSEISYREVAELTRSHCKGFNSGDIARLVARELTVDGIKVWM